MPVWFAAHACAEAFAKRLIGHVKQDIPSRQFVIGEGRYYTLSQVRYQHDQDERPKVAIDVVLHELVGEEHYEQVITASVVFEMVSPVSDQLQVTAWYYTPALRNYFNELLKMIRKWYPEAGESMHDPSWVPPGNVGMAKIAAIQFGLTGMAREADIPTAIEKPIPAEKPAEVIVFGRTKKGTQRCVDKPMPAEKPAEEAALADPEPWVKIPDKGYDHKMVKLWWEGYTSTEIGKRLHFRPKTIGNRICQLRKEHGEGMIPYRRKRSAGQSRKDVAEADHDAGEERRQSLRQQLGIQRANLNELELQRARYGIRVPLDLVNEMKLVQERIREIERELVELDTG